MYKLIGIYEGKEYAIDDTELLYGRGIHNDWEATAAAKEAFSRSDVPDGGKFRHCFDLIKVYRDGVCFIRYGCGGLYKGYDND